MMPSYTTLYSETTFTQAGNACFYRTP